MPPPSGTVECHRGRFRAGVALAPKERTWITLPTCTTEDAAVARKDLLAGLAAKLRHAGISKELALQVLERAGARDGDALKAVLEAAAALCNGEARKRRGAGETFKRVGERWTSGELARDYPDHVKVKSSAGRDRQRLERYVYPIVLDLPVASFTLDHAEAIMRALPTSRVRTPATRRHVAQLLHRLLSLAVFPLRLITTNPLPRGFLPKVGAGKAKGWLYPDEDRHLLGVEPAKVPLPWRIFYGFLHREGPRSGEAGALDLTDADLRRGVLTLDKNKTNDPRAWALDKAVVRALQAWIAHREQAHGGPLPPSAPLFVDEEGQRIADGGAERFRDHLKAAGIDRPELFERSDARLHIRLHDTRATFVTLALANGKSETWVADRTGHRSSTMINKYRRAARTAAELGLGELVPLDQAIPELRPVRAEGPAGPESPPESPEEADDAKTSVPVQGFEPRLGDSKGRAAVAKRRDPKESSGNPGGAGDGSGAEARTGDARKAAGDAEPPSPGGPRAVLLGHLAEGLKKAIEVGDLTAARVAHGAIGQLLGTEEGAVIDLAQRRRA